MADKPARRIIGETQEKYESRRSEMSDTIWIKGFKPGDTKLRPWPMPTGQWVRYYEHYVGRIKRFVPCGGSDCVLDDDRDPKVVSKSLKWIVPAVDQDGRLQYFKIGPDLMEAFKRKEQRSPTNTVSDRDWIVVRTGSGFTDTKYDLEEAEDGKYKFKFKEVGEEPLSEEDLGAELGVKYDEYVEAYGEEDEPEPEPAPKAKRARDDDDDFDAPRAARKTTSRASGRIQPGGRTKTESNGDDPDDEPEAKTDETPDKVVEAVDELEGEGPTYDDIVAAPTPVIRRWLEGREVEIPPNSTRSKIIKLAKDTSTFVPF